MDFVIIKVSGGTEVSRKRVTPHPTGGVRDSARPTQESDIDLDDQTH